ncbi:hypothetical protein CJF32_00008734 [Rutstroemia sp. NJR-2017a WRK4]|nr:hypothetical protein CJF32_00008734 [Rutstroemia sp. NJR-2017a WRK4]
MSSPKNPRALLSSIPIGEPTKERPTRGRERYTGSIEKRGPLLYFEVQAVGSRPAIPSGDVDLEAIKKRLNQEIQQAEEEACCQITEPEESREPNP